jgi:ATP-dependent RNA helicase DeaD
VSGQEIYKLQSMVRWAKLNVKRGTIPSLDEVEEARTSVFFEKIRATLEEKQFKPHDRMIDRLLDQGYASTDICSALIHLLQGQEAEAAKPAKAAPAKTKAERIAANEAPPAMRPPAPAPKPASKYEQPVFEKPSGDRFAAQKRSFDRKPRTGREPGFTTVSFNVGRAQLITPADLVGKIAGVTRLPANVVGAIDIHEEHTLVDVATEHAELVVAKLAGIRIKNQSLKPALVPPAAG